MIFTPPAFLPTLPSPLLLQEPVGDFCLAKNIARTIGPDFADKQPPFVEAAIDRAWAADEVGARVAQVAAALCSSWQLVPGQQWHKIVAILASNSVGLLDGSSSRQQSEWSLGRHSDSFMGYPPHWRWLPHVATYEHG